ncbi:two-component system, OmpR family, response regulator VicR [Lachnospiraceae bacterium NE2001]|nr:two-component system, OmpR family, response regulator VicR [Lachnospiraceae bacterium NE2001]
MRKILIVDDDIALSDITREMLENYDYQVSQVFSVEEAFDTLTDVKFDLILLDINLPDGEGYEVCKELRTVSTVPVIFASARTNVDDRVSGFEIGGDDYLPKPYSMKELLVRVNALIRRTYGFTEKDEKVTFGDVEVDLTSRSVKKGDKTINLSLKEFDLLAYLCRNKGTAIEKDKLLYEVWGAFSEVDASTLTVHIRWLREKLEDNPSQPEHIKTVFKVGYILEI